MPTTATSSTAFMLTLTTSGKTVYTVGSLPIEDPSGDRLTWAGPLVEDISTHNARDLYAGNAH